MQTQKEKPASIEDAIDASPLKGLQSVSTRYTERDRSVTPGEAAIGFQSFKDAKSFLNDTCNGEGHIAKLSKPTSTGTNGVWNHDGKAWEPFSLDFYLEKQGPDFWDTDTDDNGWIRSRIEDYAKDIAEDIHGTDPLRSFILEIEEISNEIYNANEDEAVIIGNGRYFETIKKAPLHFEAHGTAYEIGVVYLGPFDDQD